MSRMVRAVIKKYFKLLFSLALTASLGFALLAGLTAGYESLKNSLDSYLSEYGYPDAYLSTEVTRVSEAGKMEKIPGIVRCDTRLCGNTMMKTDNGDYFAARILSYSDEERQDFYFWDKKDSGGKDSILLEYHYADSHNIKPGDTVYFRVRDEYRPLFVEGIISRPETLHTKISDKSWGINYDFGYAYASMDLLTKEFEKDYNSAKEELDENAEKLSDKKDSVERRLQKKEQELADAKALLADKTLSFEQAKSEAENAVAKLNQTKQELQETLDEIGIKQQEADRKYIEISKNRTLLRNIKKVLKQYRHKKLDTDDLIEMLTELAEVFGFPVDFTDPDKSFEELIREFVQAAVKEIEEHPELVEEKLEELEELVSWMIEHMEEIPDTPEKALKYFLHQINELIWQCNDGLSQILAAKAEMAAGVEKILAGMSEIDQTLAQIGEQLSEAEAELASARELIQSKEAELNQKSSDILKEFSDLEKELDEAYKELSEEESYDSLCNQFLLYFDENTDSRAALQAAIDSLPKDVEVTSSYVYEDSPVKERIDKNLKPLYSLAVYCPGIFYLVTLGILFMFMSMIIRQSRREIGILRALGFSKNSIRGMFCLVSLLVAVTGLLIGCGIGYGILRYIGAYFIDFFPMPVFYYTVDAGMTAAGASATIAVCLIATLITTASISKVMPKEAMSRPVRDSVKIPGWIRKLTERMKPINKFSVVSLLRNKGRFLFAAVCTAVSVMLIFASISFIASKNQVIKQTFHDRIHYDCQIFFEDAPTQEVQDLLKEQDILTDIEELLYYEVPISSESGTEKAVIHAIEPESDMVGIQDSEGEPLSVREGEIILERHLAEKLNVKAGDSVTINEAEFIVGGIAEQCANLTQYVALADADRIGTPDLGCFLCDLPAENKQELLSFLIEEESMEGYLYTIFMDSFYRYNLELFSTYDTGAWILIIFSILIGFVIILNTMMTNMQELKHELCVLKSLGFSDGEISRSRLSHIALQFLIAAPIGLAGGILFAVNILKQIGSAEEEYVFSSGLKEYIITILIVLAYLLISHFISISRMKKWNLPENVKDRE